MGSTPPYADLFFPDGWFISSLCSWTKKKLDEIVRSLPQVPLNAENAKNTIISNMIF